MILWASFIISHQNLRGKLEPHKFCVFSLKPTHLKCSPPTAGILKVFFILPVFLMMACSSLSFKASSPVPITADMLRLLESSSMISLLEIHRRKIQMWVIDLVCSTYFLLIYMYLYNYMTLLKHGMYGLAISVNTCTSKQTNYCLYSMIILCTVFPITFSNQQNLIWNSLSKI